MRSDLHQGPLWATKPDSRLTYQSTMHSSSLAPIIVFSCTYLTPAAKQTDRTNCKSASSGRKTNTMQLQQKLLQRPQASIRAHLSQRQIVRRKCVIICSASTATSSAAVHFRELSDVCAAFQKAPPSMVSVTNATILVQRLQRACVQIPAHHTTTTAPLASGH